jgi:hypothetical protein
MNMFVFIPLSPSHAHYTYTATQKIQVQRGGCLSSGTPTKGSIDTVCSESQVFQIVTGNTQHNTCSNTSTGTAQRLPRQWYSYQRFYRHCVFRVSGLSNRHRQPKPHEPTTTWTQSRLTAMFPTQYSTVRDRESAPSSPHRACNVHRNGTERGTACVQQ